MDDCQIGNYFELEMDEGLIRGLRKDSRLICCLRFFDYNIITATDGQKIKVNSVFIFISKANLNTFQFPRFLDVDLQPVPLNP